MIRIGRGQTVAASMTPEQLLQRIEYLRKRMIDVASKKGFTSKESVAISQELDRLLNNYQNIRNQSKYK